MATGSLQQSSLLHLSTLKKNPFTNLSNTITETLNSSSYDVITIPH